MTLMIQDFIAAIATPVGTAGIGVVRVSGTDALAVTARVFRGRTRHFAGGAIYHGALVDPLTGEQIDEVVLAVYRAPASYTGEDVVEISCHGSIAVLKEALNAALNAGSPAGRARRVHKTRVPQWQDRPRSGGSGQRPDPLAHGPGPQG